MRSTSSLAVQQVAAGDREASIATSEEALQGLLRWVEDHPEDLELELHAASVRTPQVVECSCAEVERMLRRSLARGLERMRV